MERHVVPAPASLGDPVPTENHVTIAEHHHYQTKPNTASEREASETVFAINGTRHQAYLVLFEIYDLVCQQLGEKNEKLSKKQYNFCGYIIF